MPIAPAPRPARRRPVRARHRPAGRRASAFPAKPVTLIVPFLPAAPDRHLRIVAQDASRYLGQPSSWKTGRAPAARWGRPTWPRPPSRTATPFRCTPWPCCACPTCTRPTGIRSTISPSSSACRLYLRLHRARRFAVQNLQRLHRGRAQGARQHRLRLDRRGLVAAPADGGSGAQRRRPAEPRAVQGQCRHAAGAVGRTRDGAERRHRLGPVRRRRQDAPAGHFRRTAHHALARRAHGAGAGLQGRVDLALWAGRSEGHGPSRGANPARCLQARAVRPAAWR